MNKDTQRRRLRPCPNQHGGHSLVTRAVNLDGDFALLVQEIQIIQPFRIELILEPLLIEAFDPSLSFV